MIGFLVAFGSYILLLNLMKHNNIKLIDMKNEKYLICDEILCL